MNKVKLEENWHKHLESEFALPYMIQLKSFLKDELGRGKTIYPSGGQIFAALNTTPLDRVKVVIIGQDPYHGPNQAHGLCFSVLPGVTPPPSLINIFKEIQNDLGIAPPRHGYLNHWATQGVLLLNSTLTVERGRAASHQGRGWEQFTDRIVDILNREREHLVFMLWGSYAQKKAAGVNGRRHFILHSPHPSPLSASRGFFGGRHFSKANNYLEQLGQKPIDWKLP